MYGGPPLILLTVLNVYYGLGAGTPRSKFYLIPFLKDLSGNPIRQTTWGELGIWSAQDSLLVLLSLLGMICGTMFARRGGLMSLNDLLKLTGGKHSIKGGQTRTLRIGMEVKTPGGLTGVIHAAGVLDDAPLLAKSDAGIDAVLAPKVQGLRVLDQLLPDGALDLMVLFSSTSTASRAAGQACMPMASSPPIKPARRSPVPPTAMRG